MGSREVASVELRNVWKTYGQVLAVQDASWRCGDGEFFSILGPSGCGKSTLLRTVGGLLEPTAGRVYIETEIPVLNDEDFLA